MRVKIERENDGRWVAEVPDLPGVMAYGQSRSEAISKVEALALRVMADRLEHGESIPELKEVFAVPVSRTRRKPARENMTSVEKRGLIKFGSGKLPKDFWSMPKPKDPERLVLQALLEERKGGR